MIDINKRGNMHDAVFVNLLSGAIGAVIAALVAVFHQSKVNHFTFVEKWMNLLRDEFSIFLGIAENLRLETKNNTPFKDTFTIRSSLISSCNKIHLLLHPSEKPHWYHWFTGSKKSIEIQGRLSKSIDKIISCADNQNSNFNNEYSLFEKEIVADAKTLLKIHWDKVQSGLSIFNIFLYLFLFLVLCGLVFKILF